MSIPFRIGIQTQQKMSLVRFLNAGRIPALYNVEDDLAPCRPLPATTCDESDGASSPDARGGRSEPRRRTPSPPPPLPPPTRASSPPQNRPGAHDPKTDTSLPPGAPQERFPWSGAAAAAGQAGLPPTAAGGTAHGHVRWVCVCTRNAFGLWLVWRRTRTRGSRARSAPPDQRAARRADPVSAGAVGVPALWEGRAPLEAGRIRGNTSLHQENGRTVL